MTTIHTERLQLLPLDHAQIKLYLESQAAFAKTLGLAEEEMDIDPAFWEESKQDIKNFFFPKYEEQPEDIEWYTVRAIICPAENRLVGGLGGGLPDENGEAQIGYFIDNRYAGRGFATEATGGFVDWLFQHPQVKAVIADTLADGFASQKVLQRNGFVMTGETEEGNFRWRRERGI